MYRRSKKLQSQLRTKEFKLANYLRFQIRNSNDASTTSPVESANSWMKSGDVNVDSNMNANNSTTRVVRGINNRLKKRKNEAMREVKKLTRHHVHQPTPSLFQRVKVRLIIVTIVDCI